MNRVSAWVLGTRAVLKGLLAAMVEPGERLLDLESSRNHFGRLAMMEKLKAMPIGAVWDRYCLEIGVPLLFSRPFQNHGSDDASSLHF
jgi:L-rhamnose isomerase